MSAIDLPQDFHLAIIMDGNGRWAKQRSRPRLFGHEAGVDVVRKITVAARDMGVSYLTLYAFSTENWRRSRAEVNGLMRIFRRFLAKEGERLLADNVRLRILGDRSAFPEDLVAAMNRLEARSGENTGVVLQVALNYGGRDDIVRAVRKLSHEGHDISTLSEKDISGALDTVDTPDPDMILRTSGEKRISNFLIWQAAYAELAFTDTLWPDFTADDLAAVLRDFTTRNRRFGAEEVAK